MRRMSAIPALGKFAAPSPEVVAACAERAAAHAEEERRRLAPARIAAAGIPWRYLAASLADCDPAVARWASLAAEGRWDGEAPFLLLAGANGVGKSHQACAALMALAPSSTLAFCEMPEVVGPAAPTTGATPTARSPGCRAPGRSSSTSWATRGRPTARRSGCSTWCTGAGSGGGRPWW